MGSSISGRTVTVMVNEVWPHGSQWRAGTERPARAVPGEKVRSRLVPVRSSRSERRSGDALDDVVEARTLLDELLGQLNLVEAGNADLTREVLVGAVQVGA